MITIRIADRTNFRPDSLDDFDRYQVVTDVYRLSGQELVRRPNPFTETWSPERRREHAREVLSGEYITFCAFDGDRVAGGIMLLPEPDHGRLIVESFHVSREYRRQGLGRRLFGAAKDEARARGARALYISACSAVETIDFYRAMGCVLSPDPIPEMVEKEPCDIQLECAL